MISRIRGVLLPREEGMELEAGGGAVEVATAGGVVYRVEVPRTVVERLPPPGQEVELRIHHLMREDGATLYGFLNAGERSLFVLLLSASGVGGKVALSLLSTMPAARLARALEERDLAILAQAPGVGKKLAEKMAVALSDRVAALKLAPQGPRDGDPAAAASPAQSAVRALVALGMPLDQADAAVQRVREEVPDASSDELIRKALAQR
jgi:holliday junction DNA helicase RuvA